LKCNYTTDFGSIVYYILDLSKRSYRTNIELINRKVCWRSPRKFIILC